MNPSAVREARARLGLSLSQLGHLLGYTGAHVRQQMMEIEDGLKPLRGPQRRLLEAYLEGYRPKDWPLDQNLVGK